MKVTAQVALVVLTLHGLELTIASLIIYANPSLAHLTSFVPLWALLLYVGTNLILIVYGVVLYILMVKRKRAAILHNAVFNVLSVLFLVTWHIFGMKSAVGVAVDSTPSLVMLVYILVSRRVKRTLVY